MAGGWKQSEYNLNKMHRYSDAKINTELARLRSIVDKRVSTFERNLANKPGRKIPGFVDEMREIVDAVSDIPSMDRRGREMAIKEFKRFLRSEKSSFAAAERLRAKQKATMRGFGVKFKDSEFDDFLDFLNWVKSHSANVYEINAVKEVWNDSKHDLEKAEEIYASMHEMNEDDRKSEKRRKKPRKRKK